MTRALLIVLALATAATLFFALRDAEPVAAPAVAAEPVAEAAVEPGAAPAAFVAPADGNTVARTRWSLTYAFDSLIDGEPGPEGHVAGTWIVEPLRGDRVAIRLTDVEIAGGDMQGTALAGEVELAHGPDGGPIVGIGFPAGMSPTARRFYTDAATLLWSSAGAGERWQADEQGLVGSWTARYRRDGRSVVREGVELTALRGGGLGDVRYANRARFTFADGDLIRAVAHTHTEHVWPGGGGPRTRVRVEQARLDHVMVPRRAGRLTIEPIGDHVDVAARQATVDRDVLDGATAGELLAETDRVARLDPYDKATHRARSALLHKLAALVRLDPAAAGTLADAVRSRPDDLAHAGLLLGSLGSSQTAAGTDALAGLVGDEVLSADIRRNAIDHLALGRAPTDDALTALNTALDGEHEKAAAAALGAQARRLEEDDPQGATAIAEDLLARLIAAPDGPARVAALQAIGNSGTPLALPFLRGVTASPDPAVSDAAIYALRFIPGRGADVLLEGMLQVGGPRSLSAIRAIAHRDPTTWRPLLEARDFSHDPRALALADRVLRDWM